MGWTISNGAIKYVGKGTQNTKNKVRKSSINLRIYNLQKIWSRIHQVFGPEYTWSRIHHLVPNSLGPEFTWSRIHLIPENLIPHCVATEKTRVDSFWKPVTKSHFDNSSAFKTNQFSINACVNIRNGCNKCTFLSNKVSPFTNAKGGDNYYLQVYQIRRA